MKKIPSAWISLSILIGGTISFIILSLAEFGVLRSYFILLLPSMLVYLLIELKHWLKKKGRSDK